MTTTSAQATVTARNPGQELYDSIMRGIEPELCSDTIPHLAEKYKDESKEDRAKRVERYNKAYTEFDRAAATHIKQLKTAKKAHKKEAMRSAEIKSQAEEAVKLRQMESLFS
ncbi:hypothetical protein FJZ27_00010 [Candidatus Peribacteria bacterium]|nr:hypothetical protein [Candidatus Peribacteria bacterium]